MISEMELRYKGTARGMMAYLNTLLLADKMIENLYKDEDHLENQIQCAGYNFEPIFENKTMKVSMCFDSKKIVVEHGLN